MGCCNLLLVIEIQVYSGLLKTFVSKGGDEIIV
jgi:hypothetical protein